MQSYHDVNLSVNHLDVKMYESKQPGVEKWKMTSVYLKYAETPFTLVKRDTKIWL